MKVTSSAFFAGAADRSRFPAGERHEIAFIGRSNVGKSSVINSLLGVTGLARVSRTPGRTQEVHFYLINGAFFFVDLPGYGYARAPEQVREQLSGLIDAYLTARDRLRMVFLLVDSRHEPMESDVALSRWLTARGTPYQVVLTKIDKLSRGAWEGTRLRAGKALGADNAVVHSSKTGEGRKKLWQIIEHRIGWGSSPT
ncbi:MAG: YihA family ribosome biogenesis GTP-binding protein [Acidobacteria bacterium]|nr:YihA family ribosome biogenesis GTP-binding protein [Acidobacteriota bacterium]